MKIEGDFGSSEGKMGRECTEGGSREKLPRSTEATLEHAGVELENLKLSWK